HQGRAVLFLKRAYEMRIIDLIKRGKETTAADLRAKLETLRAIDPLAAIPQLRAEREKALMTAGKDDEVSRLDATILGAERDAERKVLAIADLEKQIAAAEAAEL